MQYSEAFRAKMIQRMLGPSAKSASALAKEIGVNQPTLSKWLRSARILGSTMTQRKRTKKQINPQKWTSSDKLRIVLGASQLGDDELGAFLRREGVHEQQLEQWRSTMLAALDEDGTKKRRGPSPEAKKKLAEVERDLRRKDKALAEASALLILKKKADAIWGVVDDDTDERTGK